MSGPSADGEASLTSILPTGTLRTELALLVALATDTMRRDLLATFDPHHTSERSPHYSTASEVEESLISLDDPSSGAAKTAKRIRVQRQRDLSSPQMQNHHRAAQSFFNVWQVKVLRRVGEVLGVRSDAVKQARREHALAASRLAKDKADKRYWDWANGIDDEERSTDNANEQARFAAISTRLTELDEKKRVLILHCLLLMLLSLENYTAHSRVLLVLITNSLHLPMSTLHEHESTIAQGLLEGASKMSAEDATKKRAAEDANGRRWKVGLATVAGAALIGVTGGLAAPLLAAGVGTIISGLGLGATAISGLLGTLAGSSVLIGALFGAYGGSMTGKMIDKFARQVEDFKFIPLKPDAPHQLRITIGISGWLSQESEVIQSWDIWNGSVEPFALRWEVDALLRLGTSLTSVITSYAFECARWELVRRTLLGSLYAGLWPLALLRTASIVDNPFSLAKSRADKAGRVLAEALMSKVQGERPVTLVGHSLGARLIFTCLLTLAERNAFGLVETVVLLGAPTPSLAKDWTRIRSVVSGRVVNVFSTEDYILGFLYRTSSVQFGIAGLQAVDGVTGVENVDMTKLVKGHTMWRYVVAQALQACGIEDIDPDMVQREIETMKELERKDIERKKEAEQKLEHEGRAATVREESRVFLQASEHDSHMPEERDTKEAPSKGTTADQNVAADSDPDDSDAEALHGKIRMIDLDPVPEPDDPIG